ncbi:MAG: 8-amino-7-oxononanoate synthase [Geobacteraceae bacterium]
MRTFGEELAGLRAEGLFRRMRLVEGSQGGRITLDGREALLLCSNNYLGLAEHPLLKQAATRAVEQYGAGSGSARLVSGNMGLHEALESRLAAFKETEAALLFNSGYAANTGIIPAIVGKEDVIFSDQFNHASIVDGARLSRAETVRYPHNDMAALRQLMVAHPAKGRRLIVTEGVFSMDGDMAPLPDIVAIKREFGAILMVDDAHGTGVLGANGRGSAELCDVMADIDLQIGTLGKALGSFGAYVATSRELVDYLVNRARSFIFSTSLPPSVLATSLSAIDLVDSPTGAALRKKLSAHGRRFRATLQAVGFETTGSAPHIVPIFVGEAEPTMEFTRRLLEEGLFIQGMRPPTVPTGRCRLRCTLMATHTEAELEQAVEVIIKVGRGLGII